ncbi:hypothetical protein BST55_05365 [Vibrio vulnificus]|uniref:ATP-dependent nuclease n=1 Tax=Vibrio vulnificus TaxID=672 RepID=UPI000BA0D764|nr:ATP-binding protein [Vibrio vulnificus]EGR8989123.1 AAA family ATPase [Vibrio vulnificus]EHY9867424.1 AAA family ATPase [Vibrio vulnificus]EIC2758938.1 AAA family ATPase [Vibrio vulnificus]ELC9717229.1 AAA family ATPase [Vibrio vulnificus]ELS0762508.1 AAA family ATPase [Vibrio vulnificus]
MSHVTLTSVRFKNYKALRNFSVSLNNMNILVGPNNAGKSTIISAFRLLEAALRQARRRKLVNTSLPGLGIRKGQQVSEKQLPMSLENIKTDYDDVDAEIVFRFSNSNSLTLYFPKDGGLYLLADTHGKSIATPKSFREQFPFTVQVVPVLGPLEQEERIVTEETMRSAFGTPRASRHFRNYWYSNPDGFPDFSSMLEKTWPGMQIQEPEITSHLERRLVMFCKENRADREIFWAGFGFQIWCQLLTNLSRSHEYTLTVIDEPEVYLHPDVQRQLLNIMREIDVDVLLATHSTEILGEADPSEILLIDKGLHSARRLRNVKGIQQALDNIGSAQNVTLTHLARTRKVLFVEGMSDYKFLRRFAKNMGLLDLSSGVYLTAFESGGYSSWERVKSLAWGLNNTLSTDIKIAAIYDRDYWSDSETAETLAELRKYLNLAHIHLRKEMENYLLVPSVLERVLSKAIADKVRRTGGAIDSNFSINDILDTITSAMKTNIQAQYVSKNVEYERSKGSHKDSSTLMGEYLSEFEEKWESYETRMSIVGGKQVLKNFRTYVSDTWSVSITDFKIIDEFKIEEIPDDLKTLLSDLEKFRVQ